MKPGCLVRYRWAGESFNLYTRPGDPDALNTGLNIPRTEVGVVLENLTAAQVDPPGPKPYTWVKVLFTSGTGWITAFNLDWVG